MFITFEGLDGSGKTTQIELLAEYLREQGHEVIVTREPGGTRIGDGIRQLILDLSNTEMTVSTEALLFNAARAQLVEEVIRPALSDGKIVLCDRFADSTIAYQGGGHQQAIEPLVSLIYYATGGLSPDLTIYFDVTPEGGLRRKQVQQVNRLDELDLLFYERVENEYRCMIAGDPGRWIVINAMRAILSVHKSVISVVSSRIDNA